MKTTAKPISQGPVDQANVKGRVTNNPLQPKTADNEDGLVQMKENPLQLKGEEEEPLQIKQNPLQLKYTGFNPLKPITQTGNPLQRISATPAQKKENKTGPLPVQRQVVPNTALINTYWIEGEDRTQEGPYTLLAGSAANHAIVGLTPGGGYQLYYDNEASRYVSSANYNLYHTVRAAYAGDDSIGYGMYTMAREFTEPDARTMVTWLAGQPAAVRRFAYLNRATLNLPNANRIAITWYRFPAIFPNAAAADAILGTALINYDSAALNRMLLTNKFASLAELTTVTASAKFVNIVNLEAIVTHANVDTAARLIAWLANPDVDTGNRLLTVLQNPKIRAAASIDYLLVRYDLPQISRWLGKNWATHPAGGALTQVNGRIPLATLTPANNFHGGTAGQRYTQDQVFDPTTDYHLSMSFATAPPLVNFTGLHVTFFNPANGNIRSRFWWTVNNGQVAPAAGGPVGQPARQAAATALVQSRLVDINCY